jgi:hypothetical protein
MSLTINQSIDTKEGFTVPSGTVVKFNTIFPYESLEVQYDLLFYRNQASYDNGEMNYNPKDLDQMSYSETMSYSGYTGITPTIIHEKLKDYLGTIFTGGTIDVNI